MKNKRILEKIVKNDFEIYVRKTEHLYFLHIKRYDEVHTCLAIFENYENAEKSFNKLCEVFELCY